MSLGSSPEGGEQKPGGRLQDAWKKREKPLNIDPDQIDWTKMEPLPDADIPFGLSDHPSETNGADPWQTGDHEKVLDGIKKSNECNHSGTGNAVKAIIAAVILAMSYIGYKEIVFKHEMNEAHKIIRRQNAEIEDLERRNRSAKDTIEHLERDISRQYRIIESQEEELKRPQPKEKGATRE